MSKYSTKLLGFGDNVVDIYDHLKTMYPGGNCVNVSVYGKMAGCEKTAYMGYFGDDDRADHRCAGKNRRGNCEMQTASR